MHHFISRIADLRIIHTSASCLVNSWVTNKEVTLSLQDISGWNCESHVKVNLHVNQIHWIGCCCSGAGQREVSASCNCCSLYSNRLCLVCSCTNTKFVVWNSVARKIVFAGNWLSTQMFRENYSRSHFPPKNHFFGVVFIFIICCHPLSAILTWS